MRKTNIFRCPICKKPYKTLSGWAAHMNSDHPDNRPKGYSDNQYYYFCMTGKSHGNCVVCKRDTEWNEETGKYNRFCTDPACKEKYKEEFKKRMIGKYGKVSLLNDPDQQRKMLQGRRISGKYSFLDGGKVDYVGSYEKDFLRMLDAFLHLESTEIMAPSPHTYYYEYEGEKHFYIPDFFIPNWNLEIEIKDETTTHPKFIAVDKVKEKLKDDVMASIKGVEYIKVTDKKYEGFFAKLISLKGDIRDEDLSATDNAKYDFAVEATMREFELNSNNKYIGAAIEAMNSDIADEGFFKQRSKVYITDSSKLKNELGKITISENLYAVFTANPKYELPKNSKRIIIESLTHAKMKMNADTRDFYNWVLSNDKNSYLKTIHEEKMDTSLSISEKSFHAVYFILEKLSNYANLHSKDTFYLCGYSDFYYGISALYGRNVIVDEDSIGDILLHASGSFIDKWKTWAYLNFSTPNIFRSEFVKKELKQIKMSPEELANLCHLSDNPNIKIMNPRIPDNTMRDENKAIPRICFAPSTHEAFRAMSSPDLSTKALYLYRISPDQGSIRFLKPSSKLVPDAEDTNEYWVLDPVKVFISAEFKVYKSGDKTKIDRITDSSYAKDFDEFKKSHPEYVVESIDCSGPSILDEVSGEFHDDTEPLNVKDFIAVQTADPKQEKISQSSKDLDDVFRRINLFSAVSPFKKKEMANKLYQDILDKNLCVDLSKYPLIQRYLDLPLSNTRIDSADLPESKTIVPPNQYPNNPEMDGTYEGYTMTYTGPNIDCHFDIANESVNPNQLHPIYIMLIHSSTPLANMIQKFTHDKYSHALISFNSNFDPMYSFGGKSNGKFGFTHDHLSDPFYSKRQFMPWACYVVFVNDANYKAMQDKLQYFITNENKLKYDLAGLGAIAAGKAWEKDTKYFCSGFVADILQAGGRARGRSYSLYKPQDLTHVYASYKVGEGKGFNSLDPVAIRIATVMALQKYESRSKGNNG